MYGEGISKTGEIIDMGVENNILEKSGAWFAYKGQKIAQGRENAKKFLLENPSTMEEIRDKIIANIMTNSDAAESIEIPDDAQRNG